MDFSMGNTQNTSTARIPIPIYPYSSVLELSSFLASPGRVMLSRLKHIFTLCSRTHSNGAFPSEEH